MKTFFTPKDRAQWTRHQQNAIHLATLRGQVFYSTLDNTYYLTKYHPSVIVKRHYEKYRVIDVTRVRGFYLGAYPKKIAECAARKLNTLDWQQMDKYIMCIKGMTRPHNGYWF